MNDYVYRPVELDHLSWYQFASEYDVVNITNSNRVDLLEFLPEHPQHETRGIISVEKKRVPLVSFQDFPSAADFPGDLLDSAVEPNAASEKYSKAVLSLFVPFRDDEKFNHQENGNIYTQMLRDSYNQEMLTEETIRILQNIQNCRDMLSAGRQEDMLERRTKPLPPRASKGDNNDCDEETDDQLRKHIETFLTELASDLDEDNGFASSEHTTIRLDDTRKMGDNNCGYDGICAGHVNESACIYQVDGMQQDEDTAATSPHSEATLNLNGAITKALLTRLSLEVVRRNIQNINELEQLNPAIGTAQSIQEWAKVVFTDTETGETDEDQQRAFEVITSMFILTFHEDASRNEGLQEYGTQAPFQRGIYQKTRRQLELLSGMRHHRQLLMFLTGAGGSGKSRVIDAVLAYSKGFCKRLGVLFDKRMIVVTALTGVAATLINGETVNSAVHLERDKITNDHIAEWKNTRLLIIDEISFASSSLLLSLNEKLGLLKEVVRSKYGGLHVVFTGDFAQLEPINGHPLYYESNLALWHDWINCFIELHGQHRFKQDPQFGRAMGRMQQGIPTLDDIRLINTRVLDGDSKNSPKWTDLPEGLSYAVYRNKNRSAINSGIFAEHLKRTHSTNPSVIPPKHTLVIRSDVLTWKTNKKTFGKTARHTLWSKCSDSDVTTSGEKKKYIDTFLKLFHGAALMYTENHDVSNGIANGTLCYLEKVVLREGVRETDFQMMNIDGYWVRTIDASKVDHLLCRFEKSNRTFKVKASNIGCKINMPMELIPGQSIRQTVHATVNRFPVLLNNCTTGHKLQGQTKENLLVSEWYYGKNWPYVVLSRVKTLKGLFLKEPLRENHDFSYDNRLTRMLARMRQRSPAPYDPDDR